MRPNHSDYHFTNLGDLYAERIPSNPLEPINIRPHYSDHRFDQPQTTYLASGMRDEGSHAIKGLSYDYDDRLRQWSYTKFEASFAAADRSGEPRESANWFSALMTHYKGEPVEVLHVLAGVNASSGYPYFVLGYRRKAQAVATQSTDATKKKARKEARIRRRSAKAAMP